LKEYPPRKSRKQSEGCFLKDERKSTYTGIKVWLLPKALCMPAPTPSARIMEFLYPKYALMSIDDMSLLLRSIELPISAPHTK